MSIFEKTRRIFDSIESSGQDSNLSGYSYYAFISYTEKDEKWAKWLQWELEHYKIPTKVRNEYKELPARVRPIFWYKTDLAGAHLSGAIKKELEQSKYMIVVCSPNSANREWVNDEVDFFKNGLKRGDKIIPFVVDGTINSDSSEKECLPRPIRNLPKEEELRCVDIREYGKNNAIINIVSTLFNIRYDVLLNRAKKEKQRLIAIYCVLFALCSLALFSCWDYFIRTKYEYYVDIADCNGMPTGIIQVNNDDAKNHYRLYRFEFRRRMLQQVVYVDAYGNPQEHTNTELLERPCIQELLYNRGELSSIICKNSQFNTLYVMRFSKNKLAVDLKDEEENQAINFIRSSTSVDQGMSSFQQTSFIDRILKSPSKIARYIYERDFNGYITKKIYAKHNGDDDDISIDANGISGFEYERDSLHRITRIRFLGKHYEYKSNNNGVAGKKYQYDGNGYLTVAEYIDKDGNLKYNEHHWAKTISIYDNKGYILEERLYGSDGKPCVSVFGFHKLIYDIDNMQETYSCYDINGNPTYTLSYGDNPGGFSILTRIKNDKGQVVELQCKDSQGNPCYNNCHVATYKFEYDNGLISSIRNYGTDNKPCININGFFWQHNSYFHKGLLTEQAFYNIEEKPTNNQLGFHRIYFNYGYPDYRMHEARTYNFENFPINCVLLNNAACIKLNYQGSSQWISEILFFGTDDKPFETMAGAKLCCERDSYGQITKFKYYNDAYELDSNDYHCAIMELEYNDIGLETTRCFYDENKAPTLINGAFKISRSYTETGQIEKICCYDTLQNLKIGPEGWAILKFEYKNNGAFCSRSHFGEQEERIEIEGVHKYIFDGDDCGRTISQAAFNKELHPTTNLQINAHKFVNLYDDAKRLIGIEYYDTINVKPFVRVLQRLNQRGLQIEQTAYNSENELVESPFNFGVAKLQTEYDAKDRTTHICATDHNGEKMVSSHGFAEAYFSYDSISETLFLDQNGKLANNISIADPYAYFIIYTTETNQRLYYQSIKLYDNNPITTRSAYCYDASGQRLLKAIESEDDRVKVYDMSTRQMYDYYSFEDGYDECIHVVDSIQQDVERQYGKPVLEKYIKE